MNLPPPEQLDAEQQAYEAACQHYEAQLLDEMPCQYQSKASRVNQARALAMLDRLTAQLPATREAIEKEKRNGKEADIV